MVFQLVYLILITPILFWLATFIYTAKRGSPYVPIRPNRLKNITKYIKKGDTVADLGAGDGRVLVQAVKRGAKRAEGWELDALVFITAKWRIKNSRVDQSKIKLHFGDFWNADLTKFDIIYVYQMTKYLKPFKQKILSQLKPGTLIISPDYEIPQMKVFKKEHKLFVYRV